MSSTDGRIAEGGGVRRGKLDRRVTNQPPSLKFVNTDWSFAGPPLDSALNLERYKAGLLREA